MNGSRTIFLQGCNVFLGTIAGIILKTILRINFIIIIHQLVSKHLGHNRGSRNRIRLSIPFNQFHLRQINRHIHSINHQSIRFYIKCPNSLSHCLSICFINIDLINNLRTFNADSYAYCFFKNLGIKC